MRGPEGQTHDQWAQAWHRALNTSKEIPDSFVNIQHGLTSFGEPVIRNNVKTAFANLNNQNLEGKSNEPRKTEKTPVNSKEDKKRK
ncbi:hypothetical protein HI914_06626 [Erysiphe necator]|nr:hypothetical protein HI914_06626 [Erysiphe necator]